MSSKKINLGIFILSNMWGGAEESVFKIASFVDKKRFSVHLLVNDFLYQNYIDIKNVKLVNLGQLESKRKIKKVITILKIKSKLMQYLKIFNINILHAQLENSLIVLGLSKSIDMPLIFTLRGQETAIYHGPKSLEQMFIKFSLQKILNNQNSNITSVSNWLIKDFDLKIQNKISITVNGVDTKLFKPLKLRKSNNSILFVGRLIKNKGVESLLQLANSLPNYEFLFAGEGPLRVLLNLRNTKYLGFKKRKDLVKLYSETTVCCFPSVYSEGMPNVGLEAIACGATVIASRYGFSEFLENNKDAIIIDPKNTAKLKLTLSKVMKDIMLRKRLSKNARKKALDYDIRKTVHSYQDLYLSKFISWPKNKSADSGLYFKKPLAGIKVNSPK